MVEGQVNMAGGNAEGAMDQVHNPVRKAGGKIRAEINGPVFLQPARNVNAREALAERQLDVWIGLVITQQNVIAGLILFDQVILKRHRLFLVFDHDGFEVLSRFEHPVALRVVSCRRLLKIRPHARAQRFGFADVNRRAPFILEDVNAGKVGQIFGFAAAGLVHRCSPVIPLCAAGASYGSMTAA